ncbi:hypothetical protein N9878_00770 [bacterium]|nr:hypothetical protein [bacterium]
MAKFVVASAADVGLLSQKLYAHDFSKPLSVEVKRHRAKRSVGMNALLHAWVGLIARSEGCDKEYIKIKLKLTFGIVDYQTNPMTKELEAWPRSTTKYNTEEMGVFLTRIEVWAIDQGISLPLLGCDEYESYREASR